MFCTVIDINNTAICFAQSLILITQLYDLHGLDGLPMDFGKRVEVVNHIEIGVLNFRG